MNKRIKKKRVRLNPRDIGDHTYTPEEIKYFVNRSLLKNWLIPHMWTASLDPNNKGIRVWKKRNIKRALKYMYHNRYWYLPYRHLKFALHLKPIPGMIYDCPKIISSSEKMTYASSAFVSLKKEENNNE